MLMRALLAAVFALAACSSEAPVLSSDISTRDMSLDVEAAGDAAGTHLRVSLRGPGGAVNLIGRDRLVLAAGAREVPMRRDAEGDHLAELAPGTVGLALHLEREAPEASADVEVPMPPLTALIAPASASRAAALEVQWTPATGPQTLTLSLAGTCIPPIARPLSIDAGHYTLLPADLAGPTTETCAVTVTLTRAVEQQSTAGPFERAGLSLTQIATATFESTP